jgi:hypothetical protein
VTLLSPISTLVSPFLVYDLLLHALNLFLNQVLGIPLLLDPVLDPPDLIGGLHGTLVALGSQDGHAGLRVSQQHALLGHDVQLLLHRVVIGLQLVDHGLVPLQLGLRLIGEETLLVLHVAVPTLEVLEHLLLGQLWLLLFFPIRGLLRLTQLLLRRINMLLRGHGLECGIPTGRPSQLALAV